VILPVDRDSSIPLRVQVRNELHEAITSGQLKPGDRIPSERELGEQFGISRLTVRAALGDLERAGLIYSRPGKGRYVTSAVASVIDQQLMHLSGFSEDMRKFSVHPSSRMIHRIVEAASPEVALQLQVAPGTQVVRLKRVRLAEGIPMAIEEAYLVLGLCPHILEQDLERGSLYEYLIEQDLKPAKAIQTLSADIPTAEEKQLLALEGKVAVMRMKRTTFLANNQPVEYVESVYTGEKYQFNVVLTLGEGSEMSGEALDQDTTPSP
jgi:GntR family transcriptional regulator